MIMSYENGFHKEATNVEYDAVVRKKKENASFS